jgi:hypothetical protein
MSFTVSVPGLMNNGYSGLFVLLPKKRKLNIGLQNLKNNRLLGHSFCFQDAGNLAA